MKIIDLQQTPIKYHTAVPDIGEIEAALVKKALSENWISGIGPYVADFEWGLAERMVRDHAVAVANGTLALRVALEALEIKVGDEVIVPAFTFVAPAAVVAGMGAVPVLADVDPTSWTIDPEHIAQLVTDKTKAVIVVDCIGHPADYDRIAAVKYEIDRKRGYSLAIIEDAAEAHGAKYGGEYCGAFGHLSTFSFYANKAITTGEGGAVLTDDMGLQQRLRLLVNHGSQPGTYWSEVVGSNYRMNSLSAAIGIGQMQRWSELMTARDRVKKWYASLMPDWLKMRPTAHWAEPSTWLVTITTQRRDYVVRKLRDRGIDARAVWPSLSRLPLYRESRRLKAYPVSEKLADEAFFLPTSSTMRYDDVKFITSVLEDLRL